MKWLSYGLQVQSGSVALATEWVFWQYRLRHQLICFTYNFFFLFFLLFYVFSRCQFSHDVVVMLRTSRSYCWYEGMNCDSERRSSLAVHLWGFDGFLQLMVYVVKAVPLSSYWTLWFVSKCLDIGVIHKIIPMPLLAPWCADIKWICLWPSSEF